MFTRLEESKLRDAIRGARGGRRYGGSEVAQRRSTNKALRFMCYKATSSCDKAIFRYYETQAVFSFFWWLVAALARLHSRTLLLSLSLLLLLSLPL